jgi:hypothetical protein
MCLCNCGLSSFRTSFVEDELNKTRESNRKMREHQKMEIQKNKNCFPKRPQSLKIAGHGQTKLIFGPKKSVASLSKKLSGAKKFQT